MKQRITLEIDYDEAIELAPEMWDWPTLLDLSDDQHVRILKVEDAE